ncbi:MAG: methyl-accepting chemotaxis protein [Syntrophomonas sp.]
MMKFAQSIRFQLLVWVIVACFLASVGQSTVSYLSSKETVTTEIQNQCLSLAQLTSDEIDTWVEGRVKEMTTMAKISEIRDMNKEAIQAVTTQLMSDDQDNLYVVWPDGTVIGNTGLQDFKLSDRDYFQSAIKGEANLATPTISKATGNLVAPIAVPIYQGDKVVGVLAATIKAEKLIEVINEVKVGETGYGFLLDKTGTFVAHPTKEYILNKKFVQLGDGLESLAAKMTSAQSGITEYHLGDGINKYAAYAPVKSTGWAVTVTVPVKEVQQPLDKMLQKIILVTALTLLLLCILLWFISGKFSRPIVEMTGITTRLSQRDLTQNITTSHRSEIGVLMNSLADMNDSLKNIFSQIADSASKLSSVSGYLMSSAEETGHASAQVSASAEEVAKAAVAQAEDAQRTSELAGQVSLAMQNVGGSTEQISQQSMNFKVIINKVTQLMTQQKDKMQYTMESTGNVSGVISDLSSKTQQIGEIVTVITNIAGQTNLLALNAAIEAARAGEAGRGFAVVAEEVRKLAEETGSATLNIASIIGEVQSQVERVVDEVDKVARSVNEQDEAVVESVAAFREIEDGANEIDNSIQDISATFEELLASSDEIAQAIENISAITEESAASAEEVTAVSENQLTAVQNIVDISKDLGNLAKELKEITDTFKLE